MGMKPKLLPHVLESFERLKREADLVLVEGAGSASEINLRRYDIANMGFARAADVPVVVIGDIDRGGVIASLVGTKAVLDPDDAALVAGFIVNKFRGDPSLFIAGKEAIVAATGWPALGFVPYFSEARHLPAEDALALDRPTPAAQGRAAQDRRSDPAADRQFRRSRSAATPKPTSTSCASIRARHCPGDADLVILPGSKTTIAGLAALRDAGFDIDIAAHVRRGGHCPRPVRRLSDAGPQRHRSRRHRGTGRQRARARPARRRDGLGRRENADARQRQDQRRRAVLRLRDAYGRDARAPTARGRLRISPTARRRARSRPTAASSAPTSTACSPTTGSAPPGSPGSAPVPRPSPMTNWSRARSTASPTHLGTFIDLDRLLSLAR